MPESNLLTRAKEPIKSTGRTVRQVPDLLVDCVQLLLQHHGQGLCVGVAAGREQVHGAEQRFPVVVVDVRHLRVALEVVAS